MPIEETKGRKICLKVACLLFLLVGGSGCTPTVTLRAGADYDAARKLAQAYCEALKTIGGDDEMELLTTNLRQDFAEVDVAQRQRYLTSLGLPPTCAAGAVKAFGKPPHVITMDVATSMGNVTDQIHLRRDGDSWRIDDVVYESPRSLGPRRIPSLKMALRSLRGHR